eukprot:TRINITY_DN5425_c0_g3_i1.p1 TRINITY_DN5425_c0_g3~~TRINITY_DN5425_c0_g3_i1.p1  ORF type:complete len:268 (+),score=48.75 TRINITY_DN5425_c0_g3_i1:99-806(+)
MGVLIKIKRRESLPEEWTLRKYNFKNAALRDNFVEINAKILEMDTPETRTEINFCWTNYEGDLNPKLDTLKDLLVKVTNISSLTISLEKTNLNDDGCVAIARILEENPQLTQLYLWMHQTKITDTGMVYIASQVSSLSLKEAVIRCNNIQVTDLGFIALVDSLFFLENLSKLSLWVEGCIGVTKLSGERIIELISANQNLKKINLNFSSTGITEDDAKEIRKIRSDHHAEFTIYS